MGSETPWDPIKVTVDALPECLDAIRREPSERHSFLVRRLIADHEWYGGSADNVVLAALRRASQGAQGLEALEAFQRIYDAAYLMVADETHSAPEKFERDAETVRAALALLSEEEGVDRG